MRADARAAQQLFGQPEPAAFADDDRLLADVPSRLFADAPVANTHNTVGYRRRLGVVADDHGGAALRADQLADRVVDEAGVRRVELPGRLVCEEQAGTVCDRRRHRDSLLLAARQFRRACVALVGEADSFEKLIRTTLPLGRRRPRQAELEGDQLACGQLRCERPFVVLVGVADVVGAVACDVPRRQFSELRAEYAHAPGGRPVEPGEDP